MTGRKKGLSAAQKILVALFIISLVVFAVLGFFLEVPVILLRFITDNGFGILGSASAEETLLSLGLAHSVAGLSAIVTGIGVISSLALNWNREAREARAIRMERDSIELEKLRLEIELLRRQMSGDGSGE